MTVDAATLRVNFPEFSDTVKYPDGQINFWIGVAASYINPEIWTDDAARDFGTQLFVAYWLSVARGNQIAAAVGGIPGASGGPHTSRTADKVSYTSAANLVTLEGGGHWNANGYGVQFLQLARMWGAGGFQLLPAGPGYVPGTLVSS